MELQETSLSTGIPQASQNIDIIEEEPQPKIRFGANRQVTKCPYCKAKMTTRVISCPTLKTHLIAVLCCMICFWPCVPYVYCIDAFLEHKHFCTKCSQYIGHSKLFNSSKRK